MLSKNYCCYLFTWYWVLFDAEAESSNSWLVAQREDSARALLLTKDLIGKDPPVMLQLVFKERCNQVYQEVSLAQESWHQETRYRCRHRTCAISNPSSGFWSSYHSQCTGMYSPVEAPTNGGLAVQAMLTCFSIPFSQIAEAGASSSAHAEDEKVGRGLPLMGSAIQPSIAPNVKFGVWIMFRSSLGFHYWRWTKWQNCSRCNIQVW